MKKIYLDIETNTKHSTIWCVCTKEENDEDVRVWTEPTGFIEYLSTVTAVVAHNGIGFDFHVLSSCWGVDFHGIGLIDTLVMSRLGNPGRAQGHSLRAWGQWLGFPKGDFTDYDGGLCDDMILYCKQDVLVLEKTYHALLKELKPFSIESIKLEFDVAKIIQEQVKNGFKLNEQKLMVLIALLETKLSGIEVRLQSTFAPTIKPMKRVPDKVIPFNPGSRQQIADRLMGLGWKPKKFTETKQPIVDEDTLSQIKDIPEVQEIIEYLLVQKRLAQVKSWYEALGADGRVHGSVITIGAVTGRMSHSKPNMAQVPAVRSPYGVECREMWEVDKDSVLVGADLSGIELRCFAHYLNDPGYTNEIVYGDVHTRNQQLFGCPTRDMAKTILYAWLYGASPSKLATIVGGKAKDGQKLRDGFNLIPGYTKLVDKIGRLSDKGWLPGLDGRRLIVRSQHSALNLLLQGAGAVVFKKWLIVQKDYLTQAGIRYKLVASVHDEVQVEVLDKGRADEAGELIVRAAVDAGIMLGMRCPVAAEYKVGLNWADCH